MVVSCQIYGNLLWEFEETLVVGMKEWGGEQTIRQLLVRQTLLESQLIGYELHQLDDRIVILGSHCIPRT